ncbi:hypothetical protein [Ammoniphilus sp. 3BR4]|uniref:hypothetical protein n=1 Tax=Ammoniphilus sp. 3BR4 TaxID=3158265 RepID=UPI003467D2EB
MNRQLVVFLILVILLGCSQTQVSEHNPNDDQNTKIDTFETEASHIIQVFETNFALPLKKNVEQFASEKIDQEKYVLTLNQLSKEIGIWHKDVRRKLLISDKEKPEIKQNMRQIKQNIYKLGYMIDTATKRLQSDAPFYKKYYASSLRDGTGPIEDMTMVLNTISQDLKEYKELRKKYPVQESTNDDKNNIMPKQMPQDFEFLVKYGVGNKNILNTFEDTFTKDMVVDPAITINLKLSQEEMKTIYDEMRRINILDYPTRFDPESNIIETPHQSYYLKIQISGEQKEIYWEQGISSGEDEAIKLKELIDWYIRDEIIQSRPEYKKLPEPRGGYS